MPSKIGLLARLFGREQQHPVIAQLYALVLGQPLLVHPSIGERLIGAYLDGAVDSPNGEVSASSGSIAIINISGPLLHRPVAGLCGPGPLSYPEICAAFDAAMADDNVSAIVLRMNSPGGMASGCFDLTDHIYASRGKKPIVAQIDDMAYSGGYAIAAACDSIQTTRTGGGGSIGAYTYHADYSEANAKAGVKITYIFAGAKKVDGNPDEPLSPSARADDQSSIDMLYGLFTQSVATYRGMDVQAVIDTQAGCYNGDQLVAAGLADSVGTLEDLLAKLSQPAEPAEPADASQENDDMSETTPNPAPGQPAVVAAPAAQLSAEQIAQIARARVTEAVMAAGLPPQIAVALLDPAANVSEESAAARITHARQVADACAAAKLGGTEKSYIVNSTPIDQVRKSLQEAVADPPEEELVTAHPPGKPAQAGKSSAQSIYERRRAAAAGNGKNRGNR